MSLSLDEAWLFKHLHVGLSFTLGFQKPAANFSHVTRGCMHTETSFTSEPLHPPPSVLQLESFMSASSIQEWSVPIIIVCSTDFFLMFIFESKENMFEKKKIAKAWIIISRILFMFFWGQKSFNGTKMFWESDLIIYVKYSLPSRGENKSKCQIHCF